MTNTRTLEERLKFDNGLRIGQNLVELTKGEQIKRAICAISPRGIVRVLVQPDASAMYSSWYRVRGDKSSFGRGEGVIVWGARDPSIMAMFDGEPVARIAL